MNNQFIQRVMFDWDRINKNSYLKRMEAFQGIERLDFNNSLIFLLEKMEVANQHY